MLKKITLLALLLVVFGKGYSQNIQVTGKIKDTATNANVKNAVVALLSPKDSILKAFTRVKENGTYVLSNVKPGKYILSVSHPNFGEYVEDVELNATNSALPVVALTTKMKLLEAVIVRSGNPIKIKGDTTVYTADSFKVSANANVEELLKKLPGIQVDKNGGIKAMGQTVEKVLVDGEEFFGDDPGMAVKNLRADAVKEVQVFDKKSEQAEFTGIDDGKTKKTINLKLKEDKKKGYFGKIDLAGGINNKFGNRYNDNLLLSSFKGKRKLSGFLLNGNTGQDGLSWQDEQKYGTGDNEGMVMDEESGFNFYSRGGSSDEEPTINAQNGYLTNINAGVQYSNTFGNGDKVNVSPKYNEQRYTNTTKTYEQTNGINNAPTLNSNNTEVNNIDRHNLKIKGVYDIKLDSASTTLKLTANTNFYNTKSNSYSQGLTTTGVNNDFANSQSKNTFFENDKQALNLNAILKHKFKKARRTITLNTTASTLNNIGNNINISNNIKANGSSTLANNINQDNEFDKVTNSISSKVVYTEPLNKKFAMEFGYQFTLNHAANDQTVFDFNTGTKNYDIKIDSLSNQFRQNIYQNIPSAKLNYAHKKFKVNVGTGVSFVHFDLKDLSSNIAANRNYTNFTPTANLTYSYKSNHNLSIRYNGTTTQPTINQLQPLRNNTDVFNQYIGNPNLKPSFTNNINITHNGYNFLKDLWNYQSFNFNVVNNSIANNRTTNFLTGENKIQPINTSGNYNMFFWGGLGTKLKKINTRVGINVNASMYRYVDFINSQKITTDNSNTGLSLNAQKQKDKKYDIGISIGGEYNLQKTAQTGFKNKYLSANIGLDGTVYYKKVWSLNTTYELNSRQKTAQAPALTYNIVNAKLQRTFKKDEFTVYVMGRDLLNQNIGLDRSFGQNSSFTETRNDRIQRYFMVGFAWNFKNKAAVKK